MKAIPKLDIHQRITDQIIAAIELGAGDYRMPWNPRLCTGSTINIPHNPIGHYGYRGINILNLWCSQQASSYQTSEWATFRQWQSAGAQVRKGEKGTPTVFYTTLDASDQDTSGEESTQLRRSAFIARVSYVFNTAQVDGYTPLALPPLSELERHANVEEFITSSGADIYYGGPHACYVPSRDEVHLPPAGAFRSVQGYYHVALHELTHWTGHESRCARDLRNRFGTEAYAIEELIAELGAAFLSAELGIATEPRIDHARYISSWLKVLKNDKRAIFTAATKASEATNFLKNLASADQTRLAA